MYTKTEENQDSCQIKIQDGKCYCACILTVSTSWTYAHTIKWLHWQPQHCVDNISVLCLVHFTSSVTSDASCSDLNKGVQTNGSGVTTAVGSQTSLKMTRQTSAGSTKQRSVDKSSRKGKDNRSKLNTETRAQKEVERRSCNNARER